ncbi:ribonuclease H-like domain-containing protein [Epithele typhae]|uniref:ribonuclease H-like domain-containing protein n=1 Tax=Epithele typhae TaxID=378194 RepID=UPI002008C4C2|nr:ribonuclease H-like domain-containing protein [Epithele typhae]KAH9919449.1 ribonuclease H-like domain-containing protein [Epithele typhae]
MSMFRTGSGSTSERKASRGCYAVAIGRKPGIYAEWPSRSNSTSARSACEAQVLNFMGGKYRKFLELKDAEAWLRKNNPSAPLTLRQGPSDSISSHLAAAPAPSIPSNVPPTSHSADFSSISATFGDLYGWIEQRERDGRIESGNLAERCPGPQTNNSAELNAIIRALETAPNDRPLIIKSDSDYSIKSLTVYLANWKNNGWRTAGGQPVKNLNLIKYADILITERRRVYQQSIELFKVAGHSGEMGNEGADALANAGAVKPKYQTATGKA